MTRVFSAVEPTFFVEHFDYVAITDCGSRKRYVNFAERMLESKIAHQRTDDALDLGDTRPATNNCEQQLVAIVEIAFGIDHLQTIRIAIQRHPEISPIGQHSVTQRLGCRSTYAIVDIQPVGLRADGHDIGTQLMEDTRRDMVCRTMRTIDYNLQATQIEVVRESALAEFNIATARVLYAPDTTKIGWRGADNRLIDSLLNGAFDCIRQFGTLSREKLDPVIVVRVMGSRDYNTGLQAERAGKIGHSRRR
jgi:hypothetical protein